METTSRGVKYRATPEQWRLLVEEFSRSGKSLRSYSRDKGIPPTQFHYQVYRARKQRPEHGFMELVRATEAPCKLWIEAGKCRVHVERGFDAELLKQVAEALS